MPVSQAPRVFAGTTTDVLYGAQYGDILVDLLEHVPDLMFPTSVRTYRQMALYPQLKGVLAGYTLPVRRADWRVDPAGCRPEVARLVADDVGLPLLGADPAPSAARRRGVVWSEHLRLAVSGHLTYGFYPFEKRFEIRGGQARLVELSERVPGSVVAVGVDEDGSLKRIRQHQHTTADQGIGADRLVWYANEREGANWTGVSMLRPAYGAWLVANEMWRVNATSKRRTGMGIPEVTAPAGATVAQVSEAHRLATAVRVGEQAGVGLPAGFALRMRGIEGSVPDPLEFIRYLDQQMATMALAGVLDLGSTPNGSRALGEVFVDLLLHAVQSVGDAVAAEATRAVSVSIVDYNWGEDEPAPRIVCGDVGARREVTVEALTALLGSGALSADPDLEAYVRSKYGLPEKDQVLLPRVVKVPELPVTGGRRAGRVAAAADPGMRRELTKLEAAAKTDFAKVQAQWETALDELVEDWDEIGQAQADELVAAVTAAVEAGDVEALSALSVDTAEGARLLAAAMAAVAAAASAEQVDEADRQGVKVGKGEVDVDRMSDFAAALAALAGAGLAGSAGRKALRVWTPQSTAAQVGAAVRTHLGSLTDAALRDTLGAGLSTAQNEGRVAVLRSAPAAARYAASEVLDANSCQACTDVDGFIYDTLADAEAAYANGGYVGCLGGLRCRGILVTLWDDAGLEDAA